MKHISRSKTLPDKVLWYADLNGDGSIDVKDAVKLCVDYNIPNQKTIIEKQQITSLKFYQRGDFYMIICAVKVEYFSLIFMCFLSGIDRMFCDACTIELSWNCQIYTEI